MIPSEWKKVERELPPEGKVVDTLSPGGLQQELKFQRGKWFVKDGGMYVYYTPQFWRNLAE